MTGHETTKRLSSYLDEQLDERQTRQVAAHLSGCRRCRSQLEGLRRVAADLRALARSKAPAGLGLRLQQRLAREAPPPFGEGSVGRRFPVLFVRPVILVSAGVIIALGVLMVLFVQQLEQKAGGGTPFGISSGGLKVEPEPVEISGRTFRSMGGMWVESDLTVAEVAGARAIDRAVLLATRDLSRETLEILGRFQRRITLQVGGEVLRVTARRAGARRSGRVPG